MAISSSIPTFYLCVDCGGTKTAVSLASPSGEIKARALGGPSNIAYVGLDTFVATIATAVNIALSTALSLPATSVIPSGGLVAPGAYTIAAAWLGVSGADSPAIIAQTMPAISELLSVPVGPRLAITNDVNLLGAPLTTLPEVRSAVAVIAGTGSIIVSFRKSKTTDPAQKQPDGDANGGGLLEEVARAGGWGWIIGDEGGGFDVGRTALRFLLRQLDEQSAGRQPIPDTPAPLLKSVLERFKIKELLDVLGAVHVPDPITDAPEAGPGEYDYTAYAREKRLSALSPLVFKAAYEEGDPLAMEVLKDCAGKLAGQIATVLAEPSVSEPQPRRVPASTSVVSFGGSLVGLESYRALVLDKLKEGGHVFKHVEIVKDASSAGALALAASWKDA